MIIVRQPEKGFPVVETNFTNTEDKYNDNGLHIRRYLQKRATYDNKK